MLAQMYPDIEPGLDAGIVTLSGGRPGEFRTKVPLAVKGTTSLSVPQVDAHAAAGALVLVLGVVAAAAVAVAVAGVLAVGVELETAVGGGTCALAA